MKKFSGSAVARHQVFMLADGTYVVLWDDKRVQELLTGRYREFDYRADFGHAVTDYELKQLRASGRVEHYNQHYVWLYPLPEIGRFGKRRVLGRGNRIRAYYLSTPHPKVELPQIQTALEENGLGEEYAARIRDDVVVVLGKNGVPFRTPEEADQAHAALVAKVPDVMQHLIVAFVETDPSHRLHSPHNERETDSNLDDLIASQTNTETVAGKRVVLAVRDEDERQAFGRLFEEMKLDVKYAGDASEVLQALEDFPSDLLISDIELPDLHAWKLVQKVKEVDSLRDIPIIVLTDQVNLSATIARVDYIQRPISIARLRHNVWMVLNDARHTNHRPIDES
jgi:CheY-like chemotaxis protein